MRLRRVERRADVQRRPERAIDLLLDAALPHAEIRRRAGAVTDALERRSVRPKRRPRVAVAPARLDAAEGYLSADDGMVPIRKVSVRCVRCWTRYCLQTAETL